MHAITDIANANANATSIDSAFVLDHVRAVGTALKTRFETLSPVIERDAMMAAFRAIDGEANATLRDALAARWPDIAWLADEFDGDEGDARARDGAFWACDAIDGAVQYLRGIPQWCVSLALVRGGRPVFAVLYDAMHDELFHAEAGVGAFLNGQPIRVNAKSTHRDAFLATSQPPFVGAADIGRAARSLERVLPQAGVVRNFGPTSLQIAWVACGRLDAFWEHGEDTFNCLGAALMVREAGGVVTDLDGVDWRLRSASIVAGPAGVNASLRKCLAGV